MNRFEEVCAIIAAAMAVVIVALAVALLVMWAHSLNVFVVPCMIIGLAFGMVYANRKTAQNEKSD